MDATLGDNIIDGLVETIDDIRADVYAVAGVRQWSATLVRRRWTGGIPGAGVPVVVSEMTLNVPPQVMKEVGNRLQPAGLEEEGDIVLAEVSLRYTEAELTGQPVAADEEVYWRLEDLQGQGVQRRFYTQSKPPRPTRDSNSIGVGWQLYLRRIQVTE